MKKFTLLALAAMAFGMASADDFVEKTIHGLKTSDPSEKADVSKRNYYKIQNMRAMRLNYVTKTILGADGDSIGKDGAVIALDSMLYYFEGMEDWTADKDGKPVMGADGNQLATPVTSDNDNYAYMGLSALGGNWWLSFSAQSEVKDDRTIYWWFEDASTEDDDTNDGSLWIHNAVMDGLVSGTSGHVKDLAGYNRANMDFKGSDDTSTKQKKAQHRYYLLPVQEAWEKAFADGNISEDWVDYVLNGIPGDGEDAERSKPSLTAEQLKNAYAFCRSNEIKAGAGDCLDMNNYVNYKFRGIKRDPVTGDTIFSNPEERTGAQYYGYGFAGVDRTWTPLTTTSNQNHWVNNGTLFFFKPVEDVTEVTTAIEQYKGQIAAEFQRGALEEAKGEMQNAAQVIKAWTKLPSIWAEETHSELNALATECENWNGEGIDIATVTDLNSRAKYIKEVKALADSKLEAGAALVGNGCVVKFMNMLRFDLHQAFNNGGLVDADPEITDHNCLTAGGMVTYHSGGAKPVREMAGHAVTNEEDIEDGRNEWELVPAGAGKFYLKSTYNDEYIMKHSYMKDIISEMIDDDIATIDENQISWGTTPEIEDAAPFDIIGCPYDEDPHGVPADDGDNTWEQWYLQSIPADYQFSLEDKVQLTSTYDVKINSFLTETKVEYLHITNGSTDYKVCNFAPTPNSWLAGSNTFQVVGVEMGGINEVAAAEKPYNAGIYDLQGRKVVKADKGLYIINGVKTLVK